MILSDLSCNFKNHHLLWPDCTKITKFQRDQQDPTLSITRVVNTQIPNEIHMTISLDATTGITMAFSMHYILPRLQGAPAVLQEAIPDLTRGDG
jgi:hypothetical protein